MHRVTSRLSTSRYRDWAEVHPEVLKPGFPIPGGMRDGKFRLREMEAKEGVPEDGAL